MSSETPGESASTTTWSLLFGDSATCVPTRDVIGMSWYGSALAAHCLVTCNLEQQQQLARKIPGRGIWKIDPPQTNALLLKRSEDILGRIASQDLQIACFGRQTLGFEGVNLEAKSNSHWKLHNSDCWMTGKVFEFIAFWGTGSFIDCGVTFFGQLGGGLEGLEVLVFQSPWYDCWEQQKLAYHHTHQLTSSCKMLEKTLAAK